MDDACHVPVCGWTPFDGDYVRWVAECAWGVVPVPVVAADCPPDEPCDPPPMPLCYDAPTVDPARPVGSVKEWAACWA